MAHHRPPSPINLRQMSRSFFVLVALLSLSELSGPAHAEPIGRHARATMMIDMRGFPDTEGLCRGPGFQRNDTDCTQFYRCVDFTPLDGVEQYTIFRFMCGPMAVFDESRSLCTGPHLAKPPCTNEAQLMELFPDKPLTVVGLPGAGPPSGSDTTTSTSTVALPPLVTSPTPPTQSEETSPAGTTTTIAPLLEVTPETSTVVGESITVSSTAASLPPIPDSTTTSTVTPTAETSPTVTEETMVTSSEEPLTVTSTTSPVVTQGSPTPVPEVVTEDSATVSSTAISTPSTTTTAAQESTTLVTTESSIVTDEPITAISPSSPVVTEEPTSITSTPSPVVTEEPTASTSSESPVVTEGPTTETSVTFPAVTEAPTSGTSSPSPDVTEESTTVTSTSSSVVTETPMTVSSTESPVVTEEAITVPSPDPPVVTEVQTTSTSTESPVVTEQSIVTSSTESTVITEETITVTSPVPPTVTSEPATVSSTESQVVTDESTTGSSATTSTSESLLGGIDEVTSSEAPATIQVITEESTTVSSTTSSVVTEESITVSSTTILINTDQPVTATSSESSVTNEEQPTSTSAVPSVIPEETTTATSTTAAIVTDEPTPTSSSSTPVAPEESTTVASTTVSVVTEESTTTTSTVTPSEEVTVTSTESPAATEGPSTVSSTATPGVTEEPTTVSSTSPPILTEESTTASSVTAVVTNEVSTTEIPVVSQETTTTTTSPVTPSSEDSSPIPDSITTPTATSPGVTEESITSGTSPAATEESTTKTSTTTSSSQTPPGIEESPSTQPSPAVTEESTTTPSTTTSTIDESISPPQITESVQITDVLLVDDKNDLVTEDIPPTLQDVNIPPDSSIGIVGQGDGSIVVIQTDPSKPPTTIKIPTGSILVIRPSQSGGKVTHLAANGYVTTSTTTSTFPVGTTFSIIVLGNKGNIVSTQTLFTTTSSTAVTPPATNIIGTVTTTNNQLTSIGKWTVSTQTVSTSLTTVSTYVVLTSTTSTTHSVVTSVSSNSSSTSTSDFISGFLIVGMDPNSSQLSDLTFQSGDLVAIIPQGGSGTINLNNQDGSPGQTFTIAPGSFLAVLTSTSGSSTNVIQQSFTSSSTITTFSPGSTVSVMQVGTDGRLIRVTFVQIANSFTITTSTQSYIGVIQTSSAGLIISIGTGIFTTQQVTGSSIYIGSINLNRVITSSFQLTTLAGIYNLASSTLLSANGDGETIQIPVNTTNAVVTSGIIQITEQESTSTRQTTLIIPIGSIFGVVTSAGPGQINGLTNGYFTSPSSTLTFPSGGTFGIISIQPDGTMILQNTYITKVQTTIVVPTMSTFGQVSLSNQGIVNGIGNAIFSTQYFVLNQSIPDSNLPTSIGYFGVLYYPDQFNLSQVIVSGNSSQNFQEIQTIVGIIHIYNGQSTSTTQLTAPSGSTLAFIPSRGQGDVIVTEGNITTTFTIVPGTIFGLIGTQSAIATNLADGFFTTNSTTIVFSSGTAYGVLKIAKNGQMLGVSVLRRAEADCTISLPISSSIGIVTLNEDQIITNIGGAPFVILPLSPSTVETSSSQSNDMVGIWDIAGYLSDPSLLSGTGSSSFSPTVTESTTSTSTEIQTLSGFLELGDSTFLSQQGVEQTVKIVPGSTNAVITSGNIVITEANSRRTIVTIPNGSMFGILTSNTSNGGQATGIINNYFTTNTTQFSFSNGATFGIITLDSNGVIAWTSQFSTSVQTVVKVPGGATFGSLTLSKGNVVTGISSAFFSTESLLISDSNDPSIPATIADFGILQFSENFQLPQSVVLSSTPINSNQSTIIGIIKMQKLSSPSSTTSSVTIPAGSSLAIIPSKQDSGAVIVTEQGSTPSTFTLFPGQIFALFGIQGVANINDLTDGVLTTGSTLINLPAGTSYGVLKIGSGGQILEYEFNSTSTSDFNITISSGSIVGLIQQIGDFIKSIGGAPFTTQPVIYQGSASSVSIGILDLTNPIIKPLLETDLPLSPAAESSDTLLGASTTTLAPSVELTSSTPLTESTSTIASLPLLEVTPTPTIESAPPSTELSTTTTTSRPTNLFPPIGGPYTIDCSLNQIHQFPLDCSRFYQCFAEDDGQQSVYIFPCAPGLYFDEASSQCLTPAETTCADNTAIQDIVGAGSIGAFFQITCSGNLYRYPLSCRHMYQCFQDGPTKTIFIFSCAEGLVFDEPTSSCLQPQESSSCDVSDNLFRSPSILFQKGQKIDPVTLIPSSLAIVKSPIKSELPAPLAVMMDRPKPRGYKDPIPLMKLALPTARKVDSSGFGTRLVPRAKSTTLFKNQ